MIVLITYKNKDDDNKTYVSHGIDLETEQVVVLQDMPLHNYNCKKFDEELREWVIE